jgi:hypothetical protein
MSFLNRLFLAKQLEQVFGIKSVILWVDKENFETEHYYPPKMEHKEIDIARRYIHATEHKGVDVSYLGTLAWGC